MVADPRRPPNGGLADGPADGALDVRTVSFEDFCSEHEQRLTRALVLALDDRELGRDAAAEGLTRAWQRWDVVRDYDNPPGWVYRVGLNWARSRLRRRRREVVTALLPDRGHLDAVADPTLVEAIAALSDDHRDVVVARFYLDWSEHRIAEALDIPNGTVKSRLHRALDQIHRHLESTS